MYDLDALERELSKTGVTLSNISPPGCDEPLGRWSWPRDDLCAYCGGEWRDDGTRRCCGCGAGKATKVASDVIACECGTLPDIAPVRLPPRGVWMGRLPRG